MRNLNIISIRNFVAKLIPGLIRFPKAMIYKGVRTFSSVTRVQTEYFSSHPADVSRNENKTARFHKVVTGKLLIFIIVLLSAGCDETLEPMEPNEIYFYSVNGFLDVSADTQWVRVMPVRETINPLTEVQEIPEVTLEHLESGEMVMMQDSLFVLGDNRVLLNFWTTMEIHPEQSYKLTIEGPDDRVSSARTTLPGDYPMPFFSQPEFNADILIVREVQRLADIQVIYRIEMHDSGIIFDIRYPHLQNSIQPQETLYRIPIEATELQLSLQESYCNFTVLERNVFVASGGPGWPEFVSMDRHTIALPDFISNVENGVGFFGGIISKTFPYIDVEGDDGLFVHNCP